MGVIRKFLIHNAIEKILLRANVPGPNFCFVKSHETFMTEGLPKGQNKCGERILKRKTLRAQGAK